MAGYEGSGSRDGGLHASPSGQDDLLNQKLANRSASRLSMTLGRLSHQGSLNMTGIHDGIVSLLPSGTEILFALGLDHRYQPHPQTSIRIAVALSLQ